MINVTDRHTGWPMRFTSWADYRARVVEPALPAPNDVRQLPDHATLSAAGFYRFFGGPLHGQRIPFDTRCREGMEITVRRSGERAVYLLDPFNGAFVCRYWDTED